MGKNGEGPFIKVQSGKIKVCFAYSYDSATEIQNLRKAADANVFCNRLKAEPKVGISVAWFYNMVQWELDWIYILVNCIPILTTYFFNFRTDLY